MAKTTGVIPILIFSKELSATARALTAAAKKLESLSRSLRKQVIDPSQAWFWTKEWQEAERKADEEIKAGRYTTYDSVDDLIADLHKAAKEHDEAR